jgi:uncharacterized membrane protein YkoI
MMELLRRSLGFAFALAFSSAGFVQTAYASADDEMTTEELSGHDHDRAEHARARGEIRPLEEIMPLIRDRITGEVADIELERGHGRWVYEIKVIDRAGRLVVVKVNATTGAIIATEGE